MALQTVRSTNLRQITIRHYPDIFYRTIVEAVRREWEDLDRLLVQFLASHSFRPKFAYRSRAGDGFLRSNIQGLLPELTRSEPIDLWSSTVLNQVPAISRPPRQGGNVPFLAMFFCTGSCCLSSEIVYSIVESVCLEGTSS